MEKNNNIPIISLSDDWNILSLNKTIYKEGIEMLDIKYSNYKLCHYSDFKLLEIDRIFDRLIKKRAYLLIKSHPKPIICRVLKITSDIPNSIMFNKKRFLTMRVKVEGSEILTCRVMDKFNEFAE